MGAFTAGRLELSSEFAQLLPESQERDLALVSARLVDSPLTRTMVLRIAADTLPAALEAARRWEPALAQHPEVARLRAGPPESLGRAAYGVYFPRRLLFLSSRPEAELAERLSPSGLARAAGRLRARLAGPAGASVEAIAADDPLLAFPALLERIRAARHGPLEVSDGRFVDRSGPAAIVFLTTRHSAFDTSHQVAFGAFLERSFAELRGQLPDAGLRLERSGIHRFAAASEGHARADVQRISLLSTLGVALVFLVFFRSLRLLWISLLPLIGGVLAATSVSIAVFGPLHVMTLAFGATLIGVCIDYPAHYLSHHALLAPAGGAAASLRRVWGAIAMGAATTIAGFVAFAWSDFPAVRQIGAFSAIGILGALLTTRVLLPPLIPAARPLRPFQRRALDGAARLLSALRRRRTLPVAVALLAAAAAGLGIAHGRWEDDLFALGLPPDPDWLAEDLRVRASVSQMDPSRFVVAFGDDVESALRGNDAVYARLVQAREEGAVDAFRSLHTFLPSASLQRRNAAALRQRPELADAVRSALAAEGFRPEAFEPFERALAEPLPEPLGYDDLARSPLADWVAPFRVDLGERVAILTFLKDVRRPERIDALLEGLDGVHYFEQQRFLAEIYGRYRTRTLGLVGAGLLAVAALLLARYRSLRLTLATLAPCLLAAGSALFLLTLLGVEINLLHLLGLLLVLSIGVDYAIFLVASGAEAPARAAALLGLCIACLSTCLSFGLLAASAFPALRALGMATAIGTVLSLALAPVVLLVLEPGRDASE